MQEYDQIYEWYLETRNHVTGVNSVKSAFSFLGDRSTVVDLGCGTGIPLTATLNNIGLRVIGVDSSPKMIGAFKKNLPGCETQLTPIQDYVFSNNTISGVLCWGCMFHLPPEDQISVLNNVFSSVSIGGRFLFTSAKEKDSTTGEMDGVTFSYCSLGSDKYNELAINAGWKLIHESEDEDKNYEYLFERVG